MEKTEQTILFLSGVCILLFWLCFYMIGRTRYMALVKKLCKGRFFMEPVFFVGIAVLSVIPFHTDSARAIKKQREMMQLFEKKQAKAEYLFLRGGEVSYVLTLVPVGLFMAAISRNRGVAFLGIISTFIFTINQV